MLGEGQVGEAGALRVLHTPGFSTITVPCPSLPCCRVSVPAKRCTPSTRRMCRTSAPAAPRRRQRPCRCPCAAPMAPSSTTRSSTPCSAGVPPGSAASEAAATEPATACLSPTARVLPGPRMLPFVLSWAPNKGQSLLLQKANVLVHCVFQGEMTTSGWAGSGIGSEGKSTGST